MPSPGFLDFGTKCPEVEKAKGILVVPFLRSYNGIVEDNNNFLRRYKTMRIILKIIDQPPLFSGLTLTSRGAVIYLSFGIVGI